MERLHPLFLAAALTGLSACIDPTARGQNTDVCTADLRTLDVTVVDGRGAPAPGAAVSARQLESGQVFTAVTDERGQTRALTEEVGAVALRVEATRGAKVAQAVEVQWVCDGCNCTPEPQAVQLQLSP
jgi:hypothetical protein